MIEINLLPGPRRKRAAAAGLKLPDFGALFANVKNPSLLAGVGSVALAAVAIGGIYTLETRRVSALEEELGQVERQARQFQALIAQKRQEERLRDSLVAELEAIRAIDADRYIWPHILEEVTKALPDFTWLESMAMLSAAPAEAADPAGPPPIRFVVDGRTGDMGGYTRFLRQLAASPWVDNVIAGPTRTVIEQDKPILSFTVTATFQRADSAFIRTAPVIESVR